MKPQPSAKSHVTGRHLDGCWFVAVTRGARLPTRAGFVQQAALPVQSPGSSGLGCDFSAVWDEIAMPCQHRLSLPGLPQTGGTAGLLGRVTLSNRGPWATTTTRVRRGSTGQGMLNWAAASVIMEKFIHYFDPLVWMLTGWSERKSDQLFQALFWGVLRKLREKIILNLCSWCFELVYW